MENSFLTILQDNWAILVSLVGLIWSYANLRWHVDQLQSKVMEHEVSDKERWARNEKEHCEMKDNINSMQPIFMEIRERLVKIETILFSMQDKKTPNRR